MHNKLDTSDSCKVMGSMPPTIDGEGERKEERGGGRFALIGMVSLGVTRFIGRRVKGERDRDWDRMRKGGTEMSWMVYIRVRYNQCTSCGRCIVGLFLGIALSTFFAS